MEPASMAWAAAAATGGLGAVALGVFHPRVPLFGPVVWRGPSHRRAVALTFDDGPHPDFTPRIAEVLGRRAARATFFSVGERVERHPDIARALAGAGHELQNHTHRHNVAGDLFSARRLSADLARCQAALAAVTGKPPAYYRPAVGIRNPPVHAAARAAGLTVVTWTVAARDGVRPFTPARARHLAARCEPGAIVALHDGTLSDRRALRGQTVESLDALLDALAARGLEPVTLSSLLG